MRKFYARIFTLFLFVFSAANVHAQLSGTKTIPGDYATIAAAVADLNLQGVGGGGVTFEVAAGHLETTTTGILLTASGTASDPIVFTKSGVGANPKITRTDGGSNTTTTLGAQGDAVFTIEGSDHVSMISIDVAATTAGAIEYGYYIRKVDATNASKNVSILNSAVTMSKGTSAYVVGIYVSNNIPTSLVSSATGVTVTSAGGRTENVVINGNTVSNVHAGIIARGFNDATPYAFYDQNITIGASGAGNTIQNFAGGSTSTAYGIYLIYQNGADVNYNIINNTAGSGVAATGIFYGIFMSTGNASDFTASFNNVNLTSGSSSTMSGVRNDAATGVIVMNNNTVQLNRTGATSSGIYGYVYNGGAGTSIELNNNTFVGSTIFTTGSTYLIYNSNTYAGTATVQNNTVTGTIARTGASGTMYGYYNAASATGTDIVSGNNFSNITLAGSSSFTGIYNAPTTGHTQEIYNNVISNISGGTGTITGIEAADATTRRIYNNQIHTFSNAGNIIGIESNTGFTTGAIYKNKIYGLTTSYTGTLTGRVVGILISSGTAPIVHNNLIGDLTMPASGSADGIRGIAVTSTLANSTVRLYYNTVYLNQTAGGTLFGSSALYHTGSTTSTTATLELKNNIFVNTSTPVGATGFTVAFRRSSSTAVNLSPNSNYNLYYAGVPSATRLIYYDGTNADQTLAAYQLRVTPAESASVSEMPPFLSTNGADATFLHINPAVATRVESGGIPIAGFPEDYDGDTRNVSTPDIGADEMNGTPSAGCSSAPTAGTITGSTSVCSGLSRTLSLSGHTVDLGVTYQWQSASSSGGTFTNIPGATGPAYSTGAVTANTYYKVVVTCNNTAQSVETPEFTLSVNALPDVVAVASPYVICSGTSTTLTATGATTYAWSPSTSLSSTSGASVTSTTTAKRTYTVTGTDGNGCIDTDTVTVQVNPPVNVTASATPVNVCNNGTSQLNATTTYVNYTAVPITLAPVTPTGATTILTQGGDSTVPGFTSGNLDDGRWNNIALPFTFKFFGNDFTAVSITTNGYLSFGTLSTTQGFNVELPATATPNNTIHAITADLDFRGSTGGTIEHFTVGTAPNRKFVVNFVNAYYFADAGTGPNPGNATVQVVLNEGTNDIEIHTIDQTNTTVNKAQGVENSGGTVAVTVPGRNNTMVWSGVPDAWKFTQTTLNYSWTPTTFLNNANIANPVASGMTANTIYTVTATDPNTGCVATSIAPEIVVGAALVANASTNRSSICYNTPFVLTAAPTGGGAPYTYSWSDGTSVISTSASFTPTAPLATTTYTVTVSDICGNSVSESETITVTNPPILTTAPASRCGIGTVTLGATAAPTATLSWYDSPSGGSVLGTGNAFTTPVIASTTTYYVTASDTPTPQYFGRLQPLAPGATNLTTYGQVFTVTSPITLNAVDVISTTGTAITISLYNSTGATQLFTSGSRAVSPNSTTAINLGWTILPGTYRLVANGMTGSFIRENSLVTYPIALGKFGQINGYVSSITGTVNTSDSYYFMYNWNITTECEGSRTPVVATVTAPPAISLTATEDTLCNGQSTTLAVSSANTGYTYSWSPGGSTSTSISVSPTATTKYVVTASDISGGPSNGCVAKDSMTVRVNPVPAPVVISPASTTVCPGSILTLSTSGGSIDPSGIISGSSPTTSTGAISPFYRVDEGQRKQYLVRASELTAAGLVAGLPINSLSFTVTAMSRTTDVNHNNFALKIGHTSMSDMSAGFETAALTTVYTNPSYNPYDGENVFAFSAPFVWDGTSNVVVEICSDNDPSNTCTTGSPICFGNVATVSIATASFVATREINTDNTSGPRTMCTETATATTYSTRPIMKFGAALPATMVWSPTTELYTDPAAITPYTGQDLTTVYAKATAPMTYTATATNAFGCTASGTTSFTLYTIPSITAEPRDTTVCPGANPFFSVTATGDGLTYQWRKDGVDIPGAVAPTLMINNAAVTDAGAYSVVVAGNCTPSDTSAVATLAFYAQPAITAEPTPVFACEATPATFSVTATGTDLTYQWRFNGVDIAGANAATYTIPSVGAAHAGNYDVVVSGRCTPSVTSVTAALTVTLAPVITGEPADVTTCVGTPASFAVTATGGGLTYQWQKNGVNLTGETAATLNIASVTVADGGNYTVIVSGACAPADTSVIAVLTVNTPPAITTHPQTQTVCAGQNATFSVTATGAALTYQWQKNGVDIAGANASTYTITGATASDAASYTVVINGTCSPSATSNAAVLTVDAAPVITQQPTPLTVCAGSNATFNVAATGVGLTYQWYRNNAAITGATGTSYTITGVTTANAAQYHVVVNSSCGTSVTSALVDLTVNSAPVITVAPNSTTACLNSTVTFNVTATGTSLTYQWKKNGTDIPGATGSSYTIGNVTSADLGAYTVVVSGICGTPVTSSAANLAVSSTNTWLGISNSDWNNAANWCAGVPTSTSVILIPSGTPFSATLYSNASIKDLTIASGATLMIGTGGNLNIYGNVVNNGTLNAGTGSISFMGTTPQTVPALTVGYVVVNTTGGVTLGGTLTVNNSLTLTNGHITLGANNLIIPGGSMGSVASHIITNGTGVVTSNNINTASVVFPVGPDAASYNPVMIANGGGRNYSVRVATGLTPALFNDARAINRTWNITSNLAPAAAASITFGYADAHANASAVPTANMEVGRHSGTAWTVINPGGVAPFGTAALRTVTTATTSFGPMVVSNTGGILNPTSLPTIDTDIARVSLRPNLVEFNTILDVTAQRSAKINWTVTDGRGRVVMTFSTNVSAGNNEHPLMLSHLAGGIYFLSGETTKGRTTTLRFVKQ